MYRNELPEGYFCLLLCNNKYSCYSWIFWKWEFVTAQSTVVTPYALCQLLCWSSSVLWQLRMAVKLHGYFGWNKFVLLAVPLSGEECGWWLPWLRNCLPPFKVGSWKLRERSWRKVSIWGHLLRRKEIDRSKKGTTLGDPCTQSWQIFLKEEYSEDWILASRNPVGLLLWSKSLSTPNRVQVSFSLKEYNWFQRKKCESFVPHLPVAILQLGDGKC